MEWCDTEPYISLFCRRELAVSYTDLARAARAVSQSQNRRADCRTRGAHSAHAELVRAPHRWKDQTPRARPADMKVQFLF